MERKIRKDHFYFSKGYHFFSANNFQLAILWFDKAIELNPDNKEAMIYRSLAKFTLGDFSGSLADFSKCMASDLSGQDPEMKHVVFEKDDIESLLNEYKEYADDFQSNYCKGLKTTLLIESVIHGEADLALYLFLKGADINEQDLSGRTALMAACTIGDADTVKWLVLSGATIDLVNKNGESAYRLACKNGHREIALWLAEVEKAKNCKPLSCGLNKGMNKKHSDSIGLKDTFFFYKTSDFINTDYWKN